MTLVWKVCNLDLKAMPQLGNGVKKNFRLIYTIMLNINKQIPWGIYVPCLLFIWGVKNGKVNQRTIGPVSLT